jgi:hypothetical protein
MTTATPAPNTTITPKQVTTTPENNNAEYFAALNTPPTPIGKKPPPPKGNKYAAITGSSANSGVPKNIQENTPSAREQKGRKSFIQGEGEGNQVNNAHIPVNVQKKLTRERKAAEKAAAEKERLRLEKGWRGGFLSSKKYSHKRRNRKLKSQKRAKLMKRKSKAHKKKASTRRR